MKFMNLKKRYRTMNLQMFAEENGEGSGEGGDDEGEDGEESDDGSSDGDSGEEEKKFSKKDVDEAIRKGVAREKRKWQREQQKKAGEQKSDGEEGEEIQKLRSKAERAEEMELKWTCLEHDVDKACVDDVLALARVHMAKDEELDIEDAIEEVLKKYPQFKVKSSYEDEDGEKEKKKSWGQRQNGQRRKTSGVEEAFLKRNPGLKIE